MFITHTKVIGWVDTEMGSYIDEWVTKNFPEQQNISAVQAAEGTLKVFSSARRGGGILHVGWYKAALVVRFIFASLESCRLVSQRSTLIAERNTVWIKGGKLSH